MNNLDGFANWLNRTNRSDSTVRLYVGRINELHNSGLNSADWVNQAKEDGLSPATVKLRLAAVKSYNKFMKIIDEDINDFIPPVLPPPSPHPVPGGIDTIRLVLAATSPGTARSAVALGALAGCRVAESISLSKSSIKGNSLIITGKGNKTRRVPISGELFRELELIHTELLVPVCNATARKAITAAFKRNKIIGAHGKDVTSHDLRATFATEVYSRTGDIVVVQRLLGHSNVADTQRYIGVENSRLESAVEFK